MRIGVLLAVIAPPLVGLGLLVVPTRAVAVVAGALATAGAGRVTAEAVVSGDLSWRGFAADPWRGGVAVLAAAVVLAAVAGARRIERTDALALASLGAGIGAIFAEHAATTAALLVVTGAGLVARTILGGVAWRSVAVLAASDVAAVAAIWLASGDGARTPLAFDGAAAWLVGAAALAKLALPGAPAGSREDASGVADGIVLGPVRAHGIVLMVWLMNTGGSAADAAGFAAAVLAAAAAFAAHRRRSWRAGLAASALLAVAGLAVETPSALLGASLLAIGVGLASALVLAGERDGAIASVGAAPLGATFAGAALVASEALGRGVVDRPFLLTALPLAVAVAWLAQAAAAMHPVVQRPRGDRIAVIAVLGAFVAVVATIPATIIERIDHRLIAGLTGGASLGAVEAAVTDRLGLVFVVAGVAAALAARGWPGVAGGARPAPEEADEPAPAPPTQRMRAAMIGLEALAAVLVIPAMVVGIGRGFL